MKKLFNIILSLAVLAGITSSCQNDENFEGDGYLKMKMKVNSGVEETDAASLEEKCVIYISNSNGLIHKYKGVENVPARLALKSGRYVAEAWTGDSVSASFDKKFYRAYEPFEITKENLSSVVLNCKIANVVVSVNVDSLANIALSNYKVTVGHTRGSLEFTKENVDTAQGYFMMPNGETSLSWEITGQKEDGSDFLRTGVIENVQRAHEYVLNINYTPSTSEIGGSLIYVSIDDTEIIVNDQIELTAAPIISGIGYDINGVVSSPSGKFERRSAYIQAVGEIEKLLVSTQAYSLLGLPRQEFDFMSLSTNELANLEVVGATCEYSYDPTTDLSNARLSFSDEMLNRLPDGDYAINIKATDSYGKSTTRTLNIKVSDAGVILSESSWYDIYAKRATLKGMVVKEGMTNPGFRYRAAGNTDWTIVTVASASAGTSISAEIAGLQPATRYEYQAIADGFVNTESKYFTTESVFEIPNASFEHWCNGGAKGALMPNSSADNIFWDSGNQGSKMISVNLCSNSSDMVHSGSYSAKLASAFCGLGSMGAFSGGNLFSGICTEVVVSANPTAKLTFGQPYNGSRPTKLIGWANYRPGSIDYCKTDKVSKGDTDHGQVYVALTSGTVYVNPAEAKYFDPNSSSVLAYGEVVWTDNFAPDGQLQQFEITIKYKENALYSKPTHIILQATASRYADYFTGATSSILYLDDLELVYE